MTLQNEMQAMKVPEDLKVLSSDDITEDIVLDNISKMIRIYSRAKDGKVSVSLNILSHHYSIYRSSSVL